MATQTATWKIHTHESTKLAVLGGRPIVFPGAPAPSKWPRVESEDIEAIIRVLRRGLLTEIAARDLVHNFETEINMWLGTRYTLTVNSGTAALHCALAGLNVQAGDEVIIPSLSYIACAAAVLQQNATPVFADVDPKTYNLSPSSVEEKISPRTKAIMAVHLHGLPADLNALLALGNASGLPILEDFSQAAGAAIGKRLVGSMGAAGAASLMSGKNLPGAGEGGILVTNEQGIRNRAARLKCFGESIDAAGNYSVIHETLGWNYRSNVLSLAFASQQLFRLDKYNDARIEAAKLLDATLNQIPGFSPPKVPTGMRHVYHMYRFRFDPHLAGLSISADQARLALRQVFLCEGLPLIEFQNCPLPGHALLQREAEVNSRAEKTRYRIDDYPGALDVLRHSLVIGYPAQAPLTDPDLVQQYILCFEKLSDHMEDFESYARTLPSQAPWSSPARIF